MKSFNEYWNSNLYNKHQELINSSDIIVNNYSYVPEMIKLLLIKLIDTRFINNECYLFGDKFNIAKYKKHITIYICKYINNYYRVIDTYYMKLSYIQRYLIDNQLLFINLVSIYTESLKLLN